MSSSPIIGKDLSIQISGYFFKSLGDFCDLKLTKKVAVIVIERITYESDYNLPCYFSVLQKQTLKNDCDRNLQPYEVFQCPLYLENR